MENVPPNGSCHSGSRGTTERHRQWVYLRTTRAAGAWYPGGTFPFAARDTWIPAVAWTSTGHVCRRFRRLRSSVCRYLVPRLQAARWYGPIFRLLFRHSPKSLLLLPLLCTAAGRHAVTAQCSPVLLRPAHILDERYSVLGTASHIWPEQFRSTAEDFVLGASILAGIAPEAAFGYKRLGLCLAFEHCVPDATLPLFHHDGNGWFPLVRRS